MNVRDASGADIAHVLAHLREHCRRELLLTRPASDTIKEIALEIDQLAPYAIVRKALAPNGAAAPAAIFAAYRASPSVAMFQTFSTEEWGKIAASFPPWFVRAAAPQLRFAGIRMAEMNVLAEPPPNLRWFALQNAYPWGGAQPRGRQGEFYQPMVWLANDKPPTVDAAGGPLVCAAPAQSSTGEPHV